MTVPPSETFETAARLVLIDDDADSRELFAEYLRLEGFEVAEFESAEEALIDIARVLPSAILTDVTLNGMSGCDAARKLRADVRTRALPIVAVTGRYVYDLREDKDLFDVIVVKPVEAAKLVDAVRKLLK